MNGFIRGDEVPVPKKLEEYLTQAQLKAVKDTEQFGWTIAFIRRPVFQPSTVVMVNRGGKKYGVLREDGTLDQEAEIHLREEPIPVPSQVQSQSTTRKRTVSSKAAIKPVGKKAQVKTKETITAKAG